MDMMLEGTSVYSNPMSSHYVSYPMHIPPLHHRFPEKSGTYSIDAGFDQSPDLKKIYDHYTKGKPSVRVVSQLSPKDFASSTAKPVTVLKKKVEYFQLLPSVVSVSSFYGVDRTIDCSGLVIEWDATKNEAVILTSAKLLLSPVRETRENYIIVRLADGTLLLGKEDYVDYHHNLLTLRVKSTMEIKAVDLRSKQVDWDDLVDGMKVTTLGRMFPFCSLFDHGGELLLQYPYFGCGELLRSSCHVHPETEGGPLITDDGFVVGINFVDNYGFGNPLPTPVILASLDLWKSYRTIVRPWFGFSVVDLHQLPLAAWERFNVSPTDSYVVVKEVYKGSIAYGKGVCPGDLVATCNGIAIHSAKQYLQLLLDRSSMVTASGDSSMIDQSFKVVIQSNDRHIGEISIEAENVAVVDKRFCEWWPCSEAEWASNKIGSQRNVNPNFIITAEGEKKYF
ncbi:putative protease Do-like 14 [Amaranthus tricolor]|uniref:putative protease Do-like 14 n=1 Tax=Amaranthus tricolor TaxID=29722 RepID=UPI00258DCEFC|nr:putative protease Do-like 14 [Amaranthus tricolor]